MLRGRHAGRNGPKLPYAFYPDDSEEGHALLGQVGQSPQQLPLLVLLDGQVLVDPSNEEVADAFVGTDVRPRDRSFDVIVIGGGPAGLAAAVYGASEGLSTLVVERNLYENVKP